MELICVTKARKYPVLGADFGGVGGKKSEFLRGLWLLGVLRRR